MIKQNPAVDNQDVALEVPDGNFLTWILEISLYRFVF